MSSPPKTLSPVDDSDTSVSDCVTMNELSSSPEYFQSSPEITSSPLSLAITTPSPTLEQHLYRHELSPSPPAEVDNQLRNGQDPPLSQDGEVLGMVAPPPHLENNQNPMDAHPLEETGPNPSAQIGDLLGMTPPPALHNTIHHPVDALLEETGPNPSGPIGDLLGMTPPPAVQNSIHRPVDALLEETGPNPSDPIRDLLGMTPPPALQKPSEHPVDAPPLQETGPHPPAPADEGDLAIQADVLNVINAAIAQVSAMDNNGPAANHDNSGSSGCFGWCRHM